MTGASRGIGADVAVGFARGGAAVALDGRSESASLQEVAQRCRDAGAAEVVLAVGDVSDAEQADAVVRQAVDGLGGVDVLVNNAGTLDSAPLVDLDVEQWDAMVASDLRSVYLCTHAHGPSAPRGRAADPDGTQVSVAPSRAAGAGTPDPGTRSRR